MELTLQDLVTIVERAGVPHALCKAEQAVRSAMRAEFPDAPDPLDFALPLPSAIYRHRDYGGY
ncbi:MAG TPA: hypothetical protein VGL72_28830 [Bryobacteraceae bacterium]|jgi:hypothetical protein